MLKGKNTQEIQTTLQNWFLHISPIIILRKYLEIVKIKLLDCKNIYKYTNIY